MKRGDSVTCNQRMLTFVEERQLWETPVKKLSMRVATRLL